MTFSSTCGKTVFEVIFLPSQHVRFPKMDLSSEQIFRFDRITIDVGAMSVIRADGSRIQLRSKTFRVLHHLISNPGRDISKDELIGAVWTDTAVVEDVIVQSIKDIRRALGDDVRNPSFIRTIPKIGYRFIAVQRSAETVSLTGSVVRRRIRPVLALCTVLIVLLIFATSFTLKPVLTDAAEARPFSNVLTPNLEAYRYYTLGVEKAQSLHNQDAIDLFERAIELDPKFAMAHARIGYAYAVTWDLVDKGKPYLETAFQLSDRLTEKDRLQIAGWYSIANLDYPAAIDIYRELVSRDPLDSESRYQLSHLLRGENLMSEAIEMAEKGLQIDPSSKKLYNQLGGLLSSIGDHEGAIAAHKRFVELSGEEPNAFDSLGLSYEWAGNYNSAADNYIKAISLKPDFEVSNIHLANTRFKTGRYTEAERLFERYIKTAPSNVEKMRGYYSLFIINLRRGDFDKADKAANFLLRTKPEWPYAVDVVRIERQRRAGEKLTNIPAYTNPGNPGRGGRNSSRPNLYYQGYFYLRNGDTDSALESFRQALKFGPQIWDIDAFEDCLGNAYLELGQYENAIGEYQRILKLNPNYPLAAYRLAKAYELGEDPINAELSYRRFLESWSQADPDLPEINDAHLSLERLHAAGN